MNVLQATQAYERWSARQVPLVPADLRLKHAVMTQSAFSFLRATCYRWMQVWPEVCADLATVPSLRAVADLHVENFGTWRDSEGRLIWGINDFDEACVLPYASDLVRLVVSAKLAGRAEHVAVKLDEASDAVLTGYLEGVRAGGGSLCCRSNIPGCARLPRTPCVIRSSSGRRWRPCRWCRGRCRAR